LNQHRVHLIGTSKTLVGGDPWVPMSLICFLVCARRYRACVN
jgi:hypothetical protein